MTNKYGTVKGPRMAINQRDMLPKPQKVNTVEIDENKGDVVKMTKETLLKSKTEIKAE